MPAPQYPLDTSLLDNRVSRTAGQRLSVLLSARTTVSTGLLGRTPVGVQVVSGRYREPLPSRSRSNRDRRHTALACRPANRLTLRRNVTQGPVN